MFTTKTTPRVVAYKLGRVFKIRSAAVLGRSNARITTVFDNFRWPGSFKFAAPGDGRAPI
jgi:hypothetical protein